MVAIHRLLRMSSLFSPVRVSSSSNKIYHHSPQGSKRKRRKHESIITQAAQALLLYSGKAVPLTAGAVESLNHGKPLLRLLSFFTTVSKEVVASYDVWCTLRMYEVISSMYNKGR